MKKIVLLFLISIQVIAVNVFDENGRLLADYTRLNFESGAELPVDILRVDDDTVFKVQRFLGAGNTTKIFSVTKENGTDEYALRLPKSDPHYIYSTNQLYPVLEMYNIPIPKRYTGVESKYILSEVVDISFDLEEFFSKVITSENQKIIDEAKNALLNFAKKTAMFSDLGDFNGTQVVYSEKNKEWVLLDWTNSFELFNPMRRDPLISGDRVFSHDRSKVLSESGREILDEIKLVTIQSREELLKIDEDIFNSLKRNPADKVKEAIYYSWKSRKYREMFREQFLIDDTSNLEKIDLTSEDFKFIRNTYKFFDSEGQSILGVELRKAKSIGEFASIIMNDNSLFSFAKREVVESNKQYFLDLGGSVEEFSTLKDMVDKNFSNCKESMKLFF